MFGNGLAHISKTSSYPARLVRAVRKLHAAEPDFTFVVPHHLRHTPGELGDQQPRETKAVQRMLGHASAAMTLDIYADPFEHDLDTVSTSSARRRLWGRRGVTGLSGKGPSSGFGGPRPVCSSPVDSTPLLSRQKTARLRVGAA